MSVDKIKPLGNRVLVKRLEAKKTKCGIILPDNAQEKPKEGEVVAVGPGKIDENGNVQKMSLKEGDKVFFSSYAGTFIPTDDADVEYLMMAEDEILGVLDYE